MHCGEIYRHDAFYRDAVSGEWLAKFFVILAFAESKDVIARLLTSRVHGRPEHPRCFHGDPYPGFYLGVLGGPLSTKSWVDLRALNDIDVEVFERRRTKGIVSLVAEIPLQVSIDLLDCVAAANDTTRAQERAIRNQLDLQRRSR